ncbi:hypothetical protein MTP03_33980 [Tsukamurella sp. PLM1]|nr:hypothetical protein MTP03_33980 [Tsukamurella sp. PLM1]
MRVASFGSQAPDASTAASVSSSNPVPVTRTRTPSARTEVTSTPVRNSPPAAITASARAAT